MDSKRNRGISRRSFLRGCVAATPALVAASGCQTVGRPLDAGLAQDPARARFVAKRPSRIRILQLTDLHYFRFRNQTVETKNEQINALVHALVAHAKPDLVMVTGDLWPNNWDGAAESRMRYAIAQLEELGIPWAYTWGNHDELPDFSKGYEAFAQAKNSLYRGGILTDGNYVVDIVSPNHRRLVQLVCLNSRTAGLGDGERTWLRKLAETDTAPTPRFAFFHVPIKQYEDAWNSGKAAGFIGEKVSGEKEDGSTLPLLKKLGVRACFCGHDHVNDFSGVVDGIELVYGRATGGYGTERFDKGGKIIDIDGRTGAFQWSAVTADGKAWRPDPGMRVDDSMNRK